MIDNQKIILYENIFASMNDGLIAISSDGQMFIVNQAAERILEYPKDQLQGKGWGEVFFLQGGNEEFNQVILDVIYDRKVKYSKIVPYQTPSGKTKILTMNSSLLRDMGKPDKPLIGMIFLFYDITEIFRLQQSERELLIKARELTQEKAEALSKLAEGVAHEIRNPVTAIGGFASRLLKENPGLKYVNEILLNARRLENIVDEVNDFTTLSPPEKEPIRIETLVQRIIEETRLQAETNEVTINWIDNCPGNLIINVDPGSFMEASRIIVENAIEAMVSGGLLKIFTDKKNNNIIISISDTGKGISQEDLPFLFDPFFSTKASGVGMNLAKAKKIIADHGGSITVESDIGKGTTFTISVPIKNDLPNT